MKAPAGFALAVAGLLLAACGGAAPVAVTTPTPEPSASATPVPLPSPTGTVLPARAWSAVVVPADGGRIRSGPGMNRSILGLEAKGRTVIFDGWYRNAADTPQLDAVSDRYEAWSRDWYHRADGLGWMHAITVDARPPAGMQQMDPNSFPIVIGGR